MLSALHLRGGFRGLRTRLVPSERMRHDLSDGVSLVGNEDTGMAVIAPDCDDPTVGLLQKLNELLQRSEVRPELERLIEDDDESVRQIQAGRYEIFLGSTDKGTRAFDFVASSLPSDTKERIIQYAIKCARRDPRLNDGSEYDFGNFSLIANYDPVPAQAPHIDVISPNYQFGLILTENTPSTQFFEVREQNRTIDSLVKLWNSFGEEMDAKMPENLINALNKNYRARSVLESFGDVLLPQRMFRRMKGYSNLQTGTLLSLPGTVIHAGPLSENFRAIVFFSAWPKGSDITAYDSDTQYSGVLLCGHLVNVLWRQRGVGFRERLFLLQILSRYVSEAPIKDMWLHWSEGSFSRLVEALESGKYGKKTTKDEFLISAARNKCLCAPWHSMDPDLGLIDLSDLVRVSVHDLATNWGGDIYDVTVYRRQDGSVILHYPEAKDPDTGSESFEGADLGDNYTLSMNEPASQLFDGTNGVLRDTRETKITFFRRDSHAQETAGGDRQSVTESFRVTTRGRNTDDKEEIGPIDLSDLVRVSVYDLATNWGGDVWDVAVYRRQDGSVVLHYPEAKDPDTGSESFEGADAGGKYTLSMSGPAGQLFDGTNGVLRDTRRTKIPCFRRHDHSQRMSGGELQSIKESSRVTTRSRGKKTDNSEEDCQARKRMRRRQVLERTE